MGADLILAWATEPEVKAVKRAWDNNQLTVGLLNEVAEAHGVDWWVDMEQEVLTEISRFVYEYVGFIDDGSMEVRRRDCSVLTISDATISSVLTGGLSWGDGPTDAFDVVTNISMFGSYLLEREAIGELGKEQHATPD